MKKIFTFFMMLSLIGLSKNVAQTVIDIDGNVYNTVTIGTQVWMNENLKTTKYRDNITIPNVTNNAAWQALTSGAYSDYNNTPSNSDTYGKLYNWYAATDIHNLCPANWHVPSDAEWNILEKFLDSTVDTTATGYVGTDIGGKLKETGTSHWTSPNTGATNSSGFAALPGGYRYYNGTYYYIGSNGNLWSTTAYNSAAAWRRDMGYSNSQVGRDGSSKANGFSVRCVMDFLTDVKKINKTDQIKLYPNPTTNYLTIETNNNSTIEIINAQGQIVKTFKISNSKTTFDISSLSSGVYTLKIKTIEEYIIKKLIKE